MIRFLSIASALCLISGVFANPPPGVTIILTDGTQAYPSNSVTTPAQVNAVSGALGPLADSCSASYTRSTNAAAVSAYAYDSIRFTDSPSIVSSTAYTQSVGAQASAGTNQIIRAHSLRVDGQPATNIHIIATFDKFQTVAPTVDIRNKLTQGGTNTIWAASTNVVCSWPDVVTDNTVTNGAYIYSFDVKVVAQANCFFRVISRDDGGSGSGFYFLVYNFISVNGRKGRTMDVTDDLGNVLHYEGGVLSTPMEE